MAGILSGLGKFGLGKLEGAELYEKKEKVVKEQEVAKPQTKEKTELDYLFDKGYTCPVCDEQFKVPTVRTAKARLIGTDNDLRPKYENIDPLKYDIVLCPRCGYAALTRFFENITPPQAKLIKQGISKNFNPIASKHSYTYDDAFSRYQLALGNSVVKKGKASEKAYLCLKMAWLLRGKMEEMDETAEDYEAELAQCKEDEAELLQSALEGFLNARQSETFPMCGLDEITVDYIIAVTAMKFEQYDVASRFVSTILASPSASERVKDRCRILKEQLIQKIK